MRKLAACAALAVVALLPACGKRGDPLPPLRPVPARITDLSAARTGTDVELRFTIPAANLDGTTPAAVDRIDVYGLAAPAGTPAPAASVVADSRNLRTSLPVRRAAPADGATPAAATAGPGEPARVAYPLQGLSDTAATLYVVAVPVVGTGRGRQGPPSAPVALSLEPPPPAPSALAITNDETELRLRWQAGAPADQFRVARTTAAGDVTEVLTPSSPLTAAEFARPVEFGREVCLAVRSVRVSGTASVEGNWSKPACLTAIDRYPPAPPASLQAVQEGTAVTLIWDAVDATDLAGYIVLRGPAGGGDLQPLLRVPIRETTYRDTTAQPGTAYVYAVYAVDNAPTANVSQLSPRQTITVR